MGDVMSWPSRIMLRGSTGEGQKWWGVGRCVPCILGRGWEGPSPQKNIWCFFSVKMTRFGTCLQTGYILLYIFGAYEHLYTADADRAYILVPFGLRPWKCRGSMWYCLLVPLVYYVNSELVPLWVGQPHMAISPSINQFIQRQSVLWSHLKRALCDKQLLLVVLCRRVDRLKTTVSPRWVETISRRP